MVSRLLAANSKSGDTKDRTGFNPPEYPARQYGGKRSQNSLRPNRNLRDLDRLVLFENLGGAQVARQSKTIAAISADNLRSLDAIVQAGRQAGVMRRDFRVLDLFLTVVGMSFHAVSNRSSVQAALGVDMLGDTEAGLRRQLVVELVSRYAAAAPKAR